MSQPQIQPAPVRRSLIVKADPQRSFAAFTANMASWWPPTHTIGGSQKPEVVLEGRVGGRWYERSPEGAECEWGKVLVWDPPGRLVLAWQINGLWKYDPTRRELFERLRSGPRAVGELARGTTVSRPAVSQHLAVLKAAGLVRDTAAGTRRVYEIDPQGLGAIRAWLDDMWGAALANFSASIDSENEQKKSDA